MTNQQNREGFKVKIGNTERPAADIISHIRANSSLPVLGIAAGSAPSAFGQVQLELYLTPGAAGEEAVKKDLNSYGGCMYQVETVEKISK
ncbi:MAG: hypothetical protein P4N59_18105 [Negativicutes bacterium]|nr:hypothetical protein [Negativicutes bacterium]